MRQYVKKTNLFAPPVPRGPKGHYLKGVGGNPTGININHGLLSSAELIRQAREQGPKCIEFLVMVRDSTEYLIRDRFNATVELLNRGYGRTPQFIRIDDEKREAGEDVNAVRERLTGRVLSLVGRLQDDESDSGPDGDGGGATGA